MPILPWKTLLVNFPGKAFCTSPTLLMVDNGYTDFPRSRCSNLGLVFRLSGCLATSCRYHVSSSWFRCIARTPQIFSPLCSNGEARLLADSVVLKSGCLSGADTSLT
jgi:hypothetical protein